jgi:hypothetical protein
MSIDHAIGKRWQRTTVVSLVSLVMLSVVGACASNAPKGSPPPTVDQVRGHTDRAFEKLKQEEQERVVQPPVPR